MGGLCFAAWSRSRLRQWQCLKRRNLEVQA
jgi:hypothetical protein